MQRIRYNHKGNTLIIAIVLVALFVIVSFGISSLIIQSSLSIAAVESSHKAFYGSESGVETALLSLKKHLPGYEEQQQSISLDGKGTSMEYSIAALTNRIPKDASLTDNTLQPNQSIILALFKDTGASSTVQVEDLKPLNNESFLLTFAAADPFSPVCLRWSVFGFKTTATETVTESMGDYICYPQNPNNILNSATSNGQFSTGGGSTSLLINQFLSEHSQNYLSLTNVPDPAVVTTPKPLLYHLEFQPTSLQLADEKFVITSTGQFKNFRQTEQVTVPQGELFPSFYFAVFNPD